jgi:diketogulonate reductase-like aldo/keto reductase
MQLLEKNRAKEILNHVDKMKPNFWVAIDDLNLIKWISEKHFVHTSRFMEGIKQTGKAQEIINKLTV